MTLDHKTCPTCGNPWLRSGSPEPEMDAIPEPMFDTEVAKKDAERVFFFQRPIGQRDASGAFKTRADTSMFLAGMLPTPREFTGIGLRWMTDADPDRVLFELSRAVLLVDQGGDRLLVTAADSIPLGKLDEISYVVENGRSRWRMDMSSKPFYPFAFRLRWAECFCAWLHWPDRRPEEDFKMRLAILGHVFLPKER